MTETVRFTVVLKVGGKPKQYLSFTDPRRDKAFAKAEREQRIMSLKQTPTGNQKDHGIIGVLREKFVSYLVFPKSLSRFAGKRVVGISMISWPKPTPLRPRLPKEYQRKSKRSCNGSGKPSHQRLRLRPSVL